MDCDVTDQLIIIYSTFVRNRRIHGYEMVQYISSLKSRGVKHCTKFSIELFMLFKIHKNETYSIAHSGKYLLMHFTF